MAKPFPVPPLCGFFRPHSILFPTLAPAKSSFWWLSGRGGRSQLDQLCSGRPTPLILHMKAPQQALTPVGPTNARLEVLVRYG